MKYSILMPYYNREKQLRHTLESLQRYERTDFEVVLVLDPKEQGPPIGLPYPVEPIRAEDKRPAYNGSRLYNQGAQAARGEYLILTSPECLHESDVLGIFDEHIDPARYLVASCVNDAGKILQHSKVRPVCYHWCSCISKQAYERIGGFDERFAEGIAFDDDAFLLRVQRDKWLSIIQIDSAIVVHQSHEKDTARLPSRQYDRLWRRNRDLFLDQIACGS